MAKKYASIHIITDFPEKILNSVIDETVSLSIKTINAHKNMFDNNLTTKTNQMFKRFLDLSYPKKILIISQNHISIYDEELTFETVADLAIHYSTITNKKVFYVSNYEYDIFIMGLVYINKIVAKKSIPNNYYCDVNSTNSITNLNNYSELEYNMDIYDFLGENDVDKLENMIKNAFDIYPDIKINDLYSDEYFSLNINPQFNLLKENEYLYVLSRTGDGSLS